MSQRLGADPGTRAVTSQVRAMAKWRTHPKKSCDYNCRCLCGACTLELASTRNLCRLNNERFMPTKHDPERRQSRRFRFTSIIRIREGEHLHDCKIIDLSLRGFRARCPSGWRPPSGAHFTVEWRVADIIKLDMQADVIRVKNGVIGCQWQAHDAESSAHLEHLIKISRLRKDAWERELKGK